MTKETRVGLMFVLAMGIFATAIYFLGNIKEMVTYQIEYDKVIGLERDSPVQFRGVPIGRVTKIVLSEELNPSNQVPIIVTIAVHNSVAKHIRTSTFADIRSVGVLGDKSILLLTEDYSAPILKEGGFIKPASKSLDVDKLLAQGEDMVSDAAAITQNLRSLLDRMANDKGPFQTLIGDKDMAADMRRTLTGLVSYVEQDKSVLNLLMKDPEFADQIKTQLSQTLANLHQVSEIYKSTEGLLPMLMSDPKFKEETKAQVSTLLAQSNAYISSLKDGRGLAYKLTQDEAYATRVSENLEKASFHLASILEKIDQGDGSAAMVVNDPSLYEGMYEVVYGLQHSGMSKWYIQHKQKKGAALKAKEGAPQKPNAAGATEPVKK